MTILGTNVALALGSSIYEEMFAVQVWRSYLSSTGKGESDGSYNINQLTWWCLQQLDLL